MKKTIFIALLTIFSLSASTVFAAEATSTKTAITAPATTENRLSEDEISSMRARVEEISKMDKTEMTVSEKKELKSEVKEIKEKMHKDGTYFYIGGGTIVLIIILLLLLR